MTRIALATVAALALGACVATGPAFAQEAANPWWPDGATSAPGPSLPIEPDVETNAISEDCRGWLSYAVDGNGTAFASTYTILSMMWESIARACMGRDPDPYARKVPVAPIPPLNAAPAPEPTPDPPPVPDMPKDEKVET